MITKKLGFNVDFFLASIALGAKARSGQKITIRAWFQCKSGIDRVKPTVTSRRISQPWAATLLCAIYNLKAWRSGAKLESLQIGLHEKNSDDEQLVSL